MSARFQFVDRQAMNLPSAEIPWAEAQVCIENYLDRADPVHVQLPGGGTAVLKALRFEKAEIQSLLTNDATHLYLMFANSPVDPANITLIAGGLTDQNNTGGTLITNLLYDFCETCPPKCASNTP